MRAVKIGFQLAFWSAVFGHGALAQSEQPFYRGKTISIYVGSAAGGSYDSYARLIAAHLGKHLAGAPSILVRNMPGAASLIAADYIYSKGARDGTDLGLVLSALPVAQMIEPGRFSIRPENFAWIGTVDAPVGVLAVWHAAGIRSLDDARKTMVTVGATTPGQGTDIAPRITNGLMGTKFKIIYGYAGGVDAALAIERGEVQGIGTWSWSSYMRLRPQWVTDGIIIPIFQSTLKRDPALPNVPTLLELAENDEQREVIKVLITPNDLGRPVIAPPGLSPERVSELRHAFDAMTVDASFLNDAKKAQLDVNPTDGAELQKLVVDMMKATPATIEKVRHVLHD